MRHKKIKSILAATVSVACLVSFAAMMPTTAATTMDANEITENMGLGFNIGNTLDSTGSSETSWGNPAITQEMVDTIKAKGFNTIRIPTTWYQHVTQTTDSDGNPVYTIDESYLERVKEVVDYAYNQDMYVILNLHHEEWINRSDFATAYDQMAPLLKQMWTQIATYFADYDQHLIFEGMNEPRAANSGSLEWTGNEECYEVVNKLDNDFVETVRSIESPYQDTRLLMIPSYAASAYSSIYGYLDVPDDDYVAVSIHAYCPYNFAMGDSYEPYTQVHDEFTSSYENELDKIFKDIQTTFTDNDIPVVIGEFGASDYNNTEARVDWGTYYLTWAKKLGIPCVIWDNDAYDNSNKSERHIYLNRDTLTWYSESESVIDAMLSVLNDSSIVWGSESHLPEYQHSDLSAATKVIYEESAGGQFTDSDGNTTTYFSAQMLNGEELNENTEIAVQFSNMKTVDLNFMNADWGNWTTVSAYEIDTEKGIAYFSYADIKKAWGDDLSTISSFCIGQGTADSRIYNVSLLPAATVVEPTTETTTTATTETTATETTTETTTDTTESVIVGDVTHDGKVNVFDVCLMKKVYLDQQNPVPSATDLLYRELAYYDWNKDETFNLQDIVGITKFILRKS